MAIVKTYLFLLTGCILFSLFDPYSFNLPIDLGVGPTFNIIDILFVLGLIVSLKYLTLKNTKGYVVLFLVVWILWGWVSILRGSLQYGLKPAIFESKYYTVFPLFLLIIYSLFSALPHLFEEFERSFRLYGIYAVLLLFLISLLSYLLTGQNNLISFIQYLNPGMYELMYWDVGGSYARFLNAYSALFLAIDFPIIVVGAYIYHQHNGINSLVGVLAVIAIVLGQVRTSWAIFAVGIFFSILTFILQSRKKHFFKFAMYFFFVGAVTVMLAVSLNEHGYIDLDQALTPVTEGVSATASFQWRQEVWAMALVKWSNDPVVGLGYGGFFDGPGNDLVWAPHSSYVAALTKQGLIGLTLMMLFYVSVLIYSLKKYFAGLSDKIKYGGFIGTLTIISTFIFAYSYETTLIQWVFLAIAFFYIETGEKELRLVNHG